MGGATYSGGTWNGFVEMNTRRHVSQVMEGRCRTGGLYIDQPAEYDDPLFGYRQQFFPIEDFVPGVILSEVDPALNVDSRWFTPRIG